MIIAAAASRTVIVLNHTLRSTARVAAFGWLIAVDPYTILAYTAQIIAAGIIFAFFSKTFETITEVTARTRRTVFPGTGIVAEDTR